MLELGEDEGGPDYHGDPPRAGGDALEGGPALGEQGESAFSLAAEAAQEAVAGAVIRVELLVSAGVLDGDVDAYSGAVAAAVGQGRHSGRDGAVEQGQGMSTGGRDVVDVARFRLRCPDPQAAGER